MGALPAVAPWRHRNGCRDTFVAVDALRSDDLEEARRTPPGEKLRQALELMELGIAMQYRKLRGAAPTASDAEIDARLLAWLSAPR